MEDQAIPISFGEWIKQRRKTLDLTQGELAQRAGCSIFALRKIETGERRPSRQLAELLAVALEIPPEDKPAFCRMARSHFVTDPLPVAPAESIARAVSLPAAVPARLPPPVTPLLGRESELAAMSRLFADPQCQLLTLTGMGGIGKTRLAVEFGLTRGDLFPGGVRYVPLASLNSAELIVPAVAEAFGFTFSGPLEPKEQLIRYLAGVIRQPALIILDNLEHLLTSSSEAVELVTALLHRLPSLKILTTSRERLNLHGEWMYELHGLPVPPSPYFADVTEYSAAALFLQSARRANVAFSLCAEDLPSLVRICQLLEGIPLAIELAAAWSPLLSCAEIAHEVGTNIDFLTTTMRDVPERHRSLRATFNHSWRLLPAPERNVLCALSVFHGGFDRVAAERIAGASLPLLASLASRSLIRRAENGRFDLHEVIRQYALLYLREDQARCSAVRDRHSEHYLDLVAACERALKSGEQQDALQTLAHDADNIRAAWLHAIERENFALLGAAVRSLGWMFEVAGLLHEGIETLEPLARSLRARPDTPDSRRILGRTLTQQGVLYFRSGTFDQALRLLNESLAVLRPVGEPALLVDPLIYLGTICYLNGDIEAATAVLQEGLAYAGESGDDWFAAFATLVLGQIADLSGRIAEGYAQEAASVAMWRRVGDPHAIAMGLNYSSLTLIQMGHFSEAEANLRESLELCRRSRNRWGLGTAYRHLGVLMLAQGEYAGAEAMLRKGLETFGDYIIGWDIAASYVFLGDVGLKTGNLGAAEENYLQGLRLARGIRSAPLILQGMMGLAEIDLQSGRCEPALELAEIVLNHPAGDHVAQNRARQIIRCARNCLGEDGVRAAGERAAARTLDETALSLLAPESGGD